MLAIRLPEEIEQRLDILAKETGRTKTFYVREAILNYIEDLEDIYLAQQILERVKKGEEPIYTPQEVEGILNAMDN